MGPPCRWLHFITILVISNVFGQELLIDTPICERAVGQTIRMHASFPSNPAIFVIWNSPAPSTIGSCYPTVSCSNPTGYTLSQDGFNYSINIDSAAVGKDEGMWIVSSDKFPDITTTLDLLAYLPNVVVFCSLSKGTSVTLDTGSSQSVTCSTDCLDSSLTNASMSFVLEDFGEDVSTAPAVSCPGSMFRSSGMITVNTSMGLMGNKSLCYKLTRGQCSFTQSDCFTVEFPQYPTTSPPTARNK